MNLATLRNKLIAAEKANLASHEALANGTGSLADAFATEKALKAAARAYYKASK